LLVAKGLSGGAPRLPATRPTDGVLHAVGAAVPHAEPFFVLAQEDLFKVLDQQNVPGR
jgi:hypothetical protein